MSDAPARKRAYSFKEGLAMMAAKDVGIDPYLAAEAGDDARSILAALRRAKTTKGPERTKHIAAAQSELRKLNPKQHGKLINALQAKLLALQGRGGDTAVAHLEPGEMVVPRAVLTPELMQLIAAEAAKRGIDPKQLIVGSRQASINPATGTEEFGWLSDAADKVKGWFSGSENSNPEIEPITVSATRRSESLFRPPTANLLDAVKSYKNWCGPGGGGDIRGPTDALCKAHDDCFDALGVNSRTFMAGDFDPSKTADLQKCNQALVDGLKGVHEPNLYGRLYGAAARLAFTDLVPTGTGATQKESRFMPGFYDAVSRFPMPRP